MKVLHERWSDLIADCVRIALVCGTIGIAVKFVTFFNHWVYFPTFPNILDAAFLIVTILYFAWTSRRHRNKR